MARKKKEEVVEEKTMETMVDIHELPKAEPKQKLLLNEDTPFRKFPTLQNDHIAMVGKKGTIYEIETSIGGTYGWFYKLNNGYYVVKEGNYTLI